MQAASPLTPQPSGLPPPGAPGQGLLSEGGTILLPSGPGEPPTLLQQPTHLPIQLRMLPPALQATLAQQQRPVMLVNRPGPFSTLQRLPPGHPLAGSRLGIQVSAPAGIMSVPGLAPRIPPGTLPGQPGILNGGFDPLHPDSQHPVHLIQPELRPGDPRLHHPEPPFVSLTQETPTVTATTPEGVPLSLASDQLNQITKLLHTQAHLAMITKTEPPPHLPEASHPFLDTPPISMSPFASGQQESRLTFPDRPPISRSEGLLPFPDRPPITKEGLLPTPTLPPLSRSGPGLLPIPDQPPISQIDNSATFSDKSVTDDSSVFKVPLLPAPLFGNHGNKTTRIPGLTLSNAEKENETIGEMDMDITSPLDDGNIEIPTSTSDRNKSGHSESSESRKKDKHDRHREEKENSRKSRSKDHDRHHRRKGEKDSSRDRKREEPKVESERMSEKDKNVSSTSFGAEPYDVFDELGGDEIPSSAVELTNKEKVSPWLLIVH